MGLSKDEFLAEAKRVFKTEAVEISEGKSVTISELDGPDYVRIMEKHTQDGKVNIAAFIGTLISACIVDDSGNRMFTEEEYKSARIPKSVIDKISEAVKRVNGMVGDEKNDSVATPQDSIAGESQLPLDFDTQTNS